MQQNKKIDSLDEQLSDTQAKLDEMEKEKRQLKGQLEDTEVDNNKNGHSY